MAQHLNLLLSWPNTTQVTLESRSSRAPSPTPARSSLATPQSLYASLCISFRTYELGRRAGRRHLPTDEPSSLFSDGPAPLPSRQRATGEENGITILYDVTSISSLAGCPLPWRFLPEEVDSKAASPARWPARCRGLRRARPQLHHVGLLLTSLQPLRHRTLPHLSPDESHFSPPPPPLPHVFPLCWYGQIRGDRFSCLGFTFLNLWMHLHDPKGSHIWRNFLAGGTSFIQFACLLML